MELGQAVYLMQSAVFQVLMLATPILVIGMTVGLIVSIIQATTSIQEQTLTFVPKIAAILLSLVFFGQWMLSTIAQYTQRLFATIPDMVK